MAPWPLSQQYQQGSSTLWLSPDVQFVYNSVQIASSEFEQFWEKQKVQKFVTSGTKILISSPDFKPPGLSMRT